MTWKVIGASATGSSHQETATPCQDAFHWSCYQDWLVALVCDGAGSARFSDRGAQHAARSITEALIFILSNELSEPERNDINFWQERVQIAIEATRNSLLTTHVTVDSSLRDFHATIVGVIAGPEIGLFFQIGDGAAAAALTSSWENPTLALPENGEYADETYFYTEDHWKEHLRFTAFSPALNYIVMVTDGAMSFVVARDRRGLDENFIGPVTRYLNTVETETGARALQSTLDDPKTYAITSDDKTLLWARRSE